MAIGRPNGHIEKMNLSWQDIEDMCVDVYDQIKRRRIKPDIIVGVSRGGLIPARILSGLFNNKNLSTIRVTFYTSPGVTLKKPHLVDDLSVDVTSKNVLIVDDVIETGKTLELVKNYVLDKGAKKALVAVLLKKKRKMLLKPDFFSQLTDKWIVYPWERFGD